MANLLLVAHAPLASSLQAVAQHVYPECRAQLRAVDVAPGASLESAAAEVRLALDALGAGDVLVLADVFGATPCNAALSAAAGSPVRVVAGVNVPMLWRTLCYLDNSLDDLVTRAVAGAAQGVMHVSVPHRQNQPTPPASDDQVQHQHQQ
jgi:PTS system mannose-specific IIA component